MQTRAGQLLQPPALGVPRCQGPRPARPLVSRCGCTPSPFPLSYTLALALTRALHGLRTVQCLVSPGGCAGVLRGAGGRDPGGPCRDRPALHPVRARGEGCPGLALLQRGLLLLTCTPGVVHGRLAMLWLEVCTWCDEWVGDCTAYMRLCSPKPGMALCKFMSQLRAQMPGYGASTGTCHCLSI